MNVIVHCPNCGSDWVDNGWNSGCLCIRINELEAKNKRLEAENMSYEKQCNAYIAQIEAQKITNREYFAAMALQGMNLKDDGQYSEDDRRRRYDQKEATWIAKAAVRYANALMKELGE